MRRICILLLVVALLMVSVVGCSSKEKEVIDRFEIGPQSGQFWSANIYPGDAAESGKIYRLATKTGDVVCIGYVEWTKSELSLKQGKMVAFVVPVTVTKIAMPSKIIVEAVASID